MSKVISFRPVTCPSALKITAEKNILEAYHNKKILKPSDATRLNF